jgi:hypothetical protein
MVVEMMGDDRMSWGARNDAWLGSELMSRDTPYPIPLRLSIPYRLCLSRSSG